MGFNALGEFNPNTPPSEMGSLNRNVNKSVTDKVGKSSTALDPEAGKFKKKYGVDNLSYPYDLFSNRREYGGNFVVFYINVPTESKLITENRVETVDITNEETYRAEINRQGYSTAGAVAGGMLVGVAAGTILGGLGGGGGGSGGVTGLVLGGVAGAVVSSEVGGKMSRQVKRLKTAIALHVPNQLTATYATQYDTDDTALFQIGAKLGEAGVKALKDLDPKQLQGAGGVLKAGAIGLALSAPGGGALSAMSGLAFNPKKEQVFKGVDYRTFTFDYQFSPRDKKELQSVQNIIKMFKFHMHPEFKDKDSFIYIYPSEFDIFYYKDLDENKALFKHTSCVLTNLSINYTPNASFNTFHDGSPTQINVQMTFKELAVLTKEEIEGGF